MSLLKGDYLGKTLLLIYLCFPLTEETFEVEEPSVNAGLKLSFATHAVPAQQSSFGSKF